MCHTAGLQTQKDRHTTSEETAALTSHPVQPHVHSATARHNSFLLTVTLLTRNRVESDTRVTRVPDVSCSAASPKQWLLLLPSVALLPCALCVRLLQLLPLVDVRGLARQQRCLPRRRTCFSGRLLDELPEELSLAKRRARLDDAGILECCNRDSYQVLASAGVTGSKSAVFDCGTGGDMDVVANVVSGEAVLMWTWWRRMASGGGRDDMDAVASMASGGGRFLSFLFISFQFLSFPVSIASPSSSLSLSLLFLCLPLLPATRRQNPRRKMGSVNGFFFFPDFLRLTGFPGNFRVRGHLAQKIHAERSSNGSSELSAHQMAVRAIVARFLHAERETSSCRLAPKLVGYGCVSAGPKSRQGSAK